MTLSSPSEAPTEFTHFFRTRLQGVKKRTVATAAALMPQSGGVRMLKLMSIVSTIYETESSTAVAGGGDARTGVPATQGATPAGGSVWTSTAGSSTDPTPSSTQPPTTGANTPPIARPVTLGSLMHLAHTRLSNITMFGPKGWDIVYDENNKCYLASDYRKCRTHDERLALRERLALEGQLGESCKNVARANARQAAWQSQQQTYRRVRPRTQYPPK